MLLVCVAALAAAAWAGDKPSAKINFLVVKDYNGKPVRNAAVILMPWTAMATRARADWS